MDAHYKHPRLHVDAPIGAGKSVPLSEAQAHYLKNVLRKKAGDKVRLFNERHGEWLATLTHAERKILTAACFEELSPPKGAGRRLHLLFPPLIKDRLDFLIEKAVELGVTDLHPVLTQQTDVRKMNDVRVRAQIIEAAEQCERHDIPMLHELCPLDECFAAWNDAIPIYAALERADAPGMTPSKGDGGFLIGPPGGFSEGEKTLLEKLPFIHPVSLGPRILRSETAALFGLSLLAE